MCKAKSVYNFVYHCFKRCITLSEISPGFSCLQYKSLENTVRKGEIARNEQFLLFSERFQAIWKTFYHFRQNFLPFSVSKGLIFVILEWINPFPNKPRFLRVCSTSLLKTLREKEILLITSSVF